MKLPIWSCLWLAAFLIGSLSAAEKYTIAVIPKGTTHEFWKAINAGAFKAQRELQAQGLNVDVIWKGPLREDDRDQQIQVVENFISKRVSGIVLAPLDSKAMVRPVNTAMRSKVPVVIIDSGLKTDNYVSYIATDNFKGGQLGAERLGELLGGKGNIILLRYAVGSASTEEREAGFLDVMKKKFPSIKILSSDQHAGATRELSYQAAQNLLNRYGKELDGMFAPCEPVTVGVLMAIRNIGGGSGKIKLVGFDAGTQSIDAMKKGDLQGLVVQHPVKMGYLGVMTLMDHLRGKPVVKQIDTGVRLVTPENMDSDESKELLYPPLDQYLK